MHAGVWNSNSISIVSLFFYLSLFTHHNHHLSRLLFLCVWLRYLCVVELICIYILTAYDLRAKSYFYTNIEIKGRTLIVPVWITYPSFGYCDQEDVELSSAQPEICSLWLQNEIHSGRVLWYVTCHNLSEP